VAHLAASLQRLDLSNTHCDDATLAAVGQLVLLDSLSLARTAVTDAGMPLLRTLPALQVLDLSLTRITNRALAAGALENALLLRRLNLAHTRISTKARRSPPQRPLQLLSCFKGAAQGAEWDG
jgi:hypothetical protein